VHHYLEYLKSGKKKAAATDNESDGDEKEEAKEEEEAKEDEETKE